jgi:hypothetical protein
MFIANQLELLHETNLYETESNPKLVILFPLRKLNGISNKKKKTSNEIKWML